MEYSLDNVFEKSWWNEEPKIETWRIRNKYVVEIRANEFEYHPPHFHVSYDEYSAVFKLKTGELYKYGKKMLPNKMMEEIEEWYESNKTDLEKAWNALHKKPAG